MLARHDISYGPYLSVRRVGEGRGRVHPRLAQRRAPTQLAQRSLLVRPI